MDASLLVGIIGGIGTVGGVFALVHWRKNGRAPQPDPFPMVPDFPVDTLAVAAQQLADLPQKLDASLQPVLTALFTATSAVDLSKQPAPVIWSPEVSRSLDRLNDRLEAVLQIGPPPEIKTDPDPWQIKFSEAADRLSELPGKIEGRFDKLSQQMVTWTERAARITLPTNAPSSMWGPPKGVAPSGPPPRAAAPVPSSLEVAVRRFNSWTLEGNKVYTLVPPERGIYAINLTNCGPGYLFLRDDADPSVNDAASSTLPPYMQETRILVPVSLRVRADRDTIVSARLVYIR